MHMLAMLYSIHLYGHHVETLDTFDVMVLCGIKAPQDKFRPNYYGAKSSLLYGGNSPPL